MSTIFLGTVNYLQKIAGVVSNRCSVSLCFLEILKYHESPCEFPQVALVHGLGTVVLEMLYLNLLGDICVKIESQMLALGLSLGKRCRLMGHLGVEV